MIYEITGRVFVITNWLQIPNRKGYKKRNKISNFEKEIEAI